MSANFIPKPRSGTGSPIREETHSWQRVVPIIEEALRTIAGYEAVSVIRKGQIRY
jgi:hypothetical protein